MSMSNTVTITGDIDYTHLTNLPRLVRDRCQAGNGMLTG
jgi:hypothetical protein